MIADDRLLDQCMRIANGYPVERDEPHLYSSVVLSVLSAEIDRLRALLDELTGDPEFDGVPYLRLALTRTHPEQKTVTFSRETLVQAVRQCAAFRADPVGEWVGLTDLVHAKITEVLGECPPVEPASDGLCHDIADAVVAAGWRAPGRTGT